ncbi:thioredoxin family protein [Candidatus Gracilibacteria bacterium]|nr:thioredoxin family protein [Candidatus Gracilibacteria bacterium]
MKYLSFAVLAVLAVFLASCSHGGDYKAEKKSEKPKNPPVEELQTTPESLSGGGNYVNYVEEFVGVAPNTVIFFHADWCGTCHKVEQDILAGRIPDDINILVANYDTETELKKKYGVTTQTTFVHVDADGELVNKWMKGDLATIIETVRSSQNNDVASAETSQEEGETEVVQKESIQETEAPQDNSVISQTVEEAPQKSTEVSYANPEPVVETSTPTEVVLEEPAPVLGGKYVAYSEDLVGQAAHTVVYFHADWCPTCVKLEKNIEAGDIPNDINILKADFDTSKELKKKYGVTSQTTLIHVSPEGELIKKWVGGDLQTIIDNVEGA